MRVATFNILHSRSPADGRVDLERYVEAVGSLDADVLALQEVDRNLPRSGNADLTSVAAEAMGAVAHRFVAALSGSPDSAWVAATGDEHAGSAAYGIALLSRYPVDSWQVVRLAGAPTRVPTRHLGSRKPVLVRDEPRVAVAARVRTPQRELTVVNTHLSFVSWWGRHQLRRLMRSFAGTDPMLLVGDLNMSLQRARAITGLTPLAEGETFPAAEPVEQLDHVLARGDLDVVAAEVRELSLSDHRALTVDLA